MRLRRGGRAHRRYPQSLVARALILVKTLARSHSHGDVWGLLLDTCGYFTALVAEAGVRFRVTNILNDLTSQGLVINARL